VSAREFEEALDDLLIFVKVIPLSEYRTFLSGAKSISPDPAGSNTHPLRYPLFFFPPDEGARGAAEQDVVKGGPARGVIYSAHAHQGWLRTTVPIRVPSTWEV